MTKQSEQERLREDIRRLEANKKRCAEIGELLKLNLTVDKKDIAWLLEMTHAHINDKQHEMF